jgi:hypothetical protein
VQRGQLHNTSCLVCNLTIPVEEKSGGGLLATGVAGRGAFSCAVFAASRAASGSAAGVAAAGQHAEGPFTG